MKILVTGGAGQIGSNLVQKLTASGHDVYVVDNLWRGSLENLAEVSSGGWSIETQFMKSDLRDFESCLIASVGMDAVIHLADIVAGIAFVFANQLFLYRSNILINTNMLAASIENNVSNYVYVGTACSYPKFKQQRLGGPLLVESDAYPAQPESAYGWSKLMGEYECELAHSEGRISTGILRLHNVYGPHCDISSEKSQVIPALCRKAAKFPEEQFIVWGSGAQRRAFVYVDDVVEAIVMTLRKGMNEGVIQIGSDKSCSIEDIAKYIVQLSGKDIPISFDPSQPEGDKDRAADTSKAKKILGWEQCVGLYEGLSKTYSWVDAHLIGSEECAKKHTV